VLECPINLSILKTQRLWDQGGWRVIEVRMNGTEIPIADFVSLRDAEEYTRWKLSDRSKDE
jgi:hypothetical protein